MIPIDTLPDFPELCLWIVGAALLSIGVWGVIVVLPGRRERCIFRQNQPAPLRWLRGEYSVTCTLLTGGPLAAAGLWWGYVSGFIPLGWKLQLVVALWCLLLGIALINAARKSQPKGMACIWIVILETLLLLVAGIHIVTSVLLLMG